MAKLSELLVFPSPVDWRLYDHEVQMGWKTSEEIQQHVDAELRMIRFTEVPTPTHAKKYLGLSKLPGLVDTLTEELHEDREKKVVLFFETRDVGMALREALVSFKPVLLFMNTPDSQRAKRLKDFTTKPWCRVAVVDLKAAPIVEASECWYVELSSQPENNVQLALSMIRKRLVLLAGTVDEALMRQRWAATEKLLEGVTA